MAEFPGSIPNGETFCCWIFYFKPSDANIVIVANLCVCESLDSTDKFMGNAVDNIHAKLTIEDKILD